MCYLPLQALLLAVYLIPQLVAAIDIHVDVHRGISNTTCCPSNPESSASPCKTLSLALECVLNLSLTTSVSLIVNEGEYTLTNDSNLTVIEGRTGGFTITGNCSTTAECRVEIICENGAGLSFIKSDVITLKNLVFSGCGFPNNSTSKNLSSAEPDFLQVTSALYFFLCQTVTISHLTVQKTEGTGVVIYSTVGTNMITNSNFTSNKPLMLNDWDTSAGGGGIYIEFAYCYPGNDSCFNGPPNIPEYYTSDSTYIISDCIFFDNLANVTNTSQFTFLLPQKSNHFAFGRGGGLSLFVKGIATNNSVNIKNCEFARNRALWGAGLLVEMQDWSSNNSVCVSNSVVSGNECFIKESIRGTGGGGARIGYIFFNDTKVRSNTISFENCNFSNNSAYFGGGISFYATKDPTAISPTNSLVFVNTTWLSNVAWAGSGVGLSVWHTERKGAAVVVNFTNCLIQKNSCFYTTQSNTVVGKGALYLNSISVIFVGNNCFISNNHSAIIAITAGIHVVAGSSINFIDNRGRHGGAVALLGDSFIQTSPHSHLVFVNNSADFAGGAIYHTSVDDHDLINPGECFIRYDDITLPPEQWKSNFSFSQNMAGNNKSESIFATSLLTCLWEGIAANSNSKLSSVFCWDGWDYQGNNCSNEVRTSPAQFRSESNFTLHLFPGQRHGMMLDTWDDRGQSVIDSSVFLARSLNSSDIQVDPSSMYISSNHIMVHSTNAKVDSQVQGEIVLETIDPRVVQAILNVTVYPCPPGMDLVSGSCQCGNDFNEVIKCNGTGFHTQIRQGYWIGYHHTPSNKMYEVVGRTPYFNNHGSNSLYIGLPNKTTEVDSFLCGAIKRTGVLCGKCVHGYGPSIHANKCVRCNANYMWLLYLVSQYLPLTLLFALVVVLDIRVTSAPANAFIFFSQVLPNVFTLDGGGVITFTHSINFFTRAYTSLYNIWNLQFFSTLNICLSPHLNSLEVISITYLEAAYPLVLIGVVSCFLWTYHQGFQCVTVIFRPLHIGVARFQQYWKIQSSLIHTFASFILLSYSRFILVSFLLLTRTPLRTEDGLKVDYVAVYDGTIPYFSAEHAPFAILSLLVLLIFAFMTPLLLIVPSLARNTNIIRKRWPRYGKILPSLNRCTINNWPRLTTFLEAFHGCYRDGTNIGDESFKEFDFRWFAGFYLVLRVVLFGVYAFSTDWFEHYSLLQIGCLIALLSLIFLRPYKDDYYNKLDAGMFFLLLGINILTMYNYGTTVISSQTSTFAFSVQYILVFSPLLYISVIVSKHLYSHMCASCIQTKGQSHTVACDREQILTQSESQGYRYLSFMEETGRLSQVNVYQPNRSVQSQSSEENEYLPPREVCGLFTN